jgi:hypothetical protein
MGFPVAPDTQSDQIFLRVITQVAPWVNVVNLKILRLPAALAAPAISL